MFVIQDKKYKWLVFVIVIIAVTFYTYSVEILTDKGYKASNIMVLRGSTALLLGILGGVLQKKRIIPYQWRPQIARFFLNGFSSFFAILSFTYLSASTVSLMNRLDIPALIIIATLLGQPKSNAQFWLSIWTIIIIVFMALDAKFIDEKPIGFVFAFLNVAIISIGYLLVQKSSQTENAYILNNVFSISNIVFGLSISFIVGNSIYLNPSDLWVILLGAIGQLTIYTVAITLYSWFSVEGARFPYLLAALLITIVEMIYENKFFGISQLGLFLITTGILFTIILNPKTPDLNLRTTLKRFIK